MAPAQAQQEKKDKKNELNKTQKKKKKEEPNKKNDETSKKLAGVHFVEEAEVQKSKAERARGKLEQEKKRKEEIRKNLRTSVRSTLTNKKLVLRKRRKVSKYFLMAIVRILARFKKVLIPTVRKTLASRRAAMKKAHKQFKIDEQQEYEESLEITQEIKKKPTIPLGVLNEKGKSTAAHAERARRREMKGGSQTTTPSATPRSLSQNTSPSKSSRTIRNGQDSNDVSVDGSGDISFDFDSQEDGNVEFDTMGVRYKDQEEGGDDSEPDDHAEIAEGMVGPGGFVMPEQVHDLLTQLDLLDFYGKTFLREQITLEDLLSFNDNQIKSLVPDSRHRSQLGKGLMALVNKGRELQNRESFTSFRTVWEYNRAMDSRKIKHQARQMLDACLEMLPPSRRPSHRYYIKTKAAREINQKERKERTEGSKTSRARSRSNKNSKYRFRQDGYTRSLNRRPRTTRRKARPMQADYDQMIEDRHIQNAGLAYKNGELKSIFSFGDAFD